MKYLKKIKYKAYENAIESNFISQFSDYALNIIIDEFFKNGIIVLPCNVGDTVYYIDVTIDNHGTQYWDIFDGKVKTVSIDNDGLWVYCRYADGLAM